MEAKIYRPRFQAIFAGALFFSVFLFLGPGSTAQVMVIDKKSVKLTDHTAKILASAAKDHKSLNKMVEQYKKNCDPALAKKIEKLSNKYMMLNSSPTDLHSLTEKLRKNDLFDHASKVGDARINFVVSTVMFYQAKDKCKKKAELAKNKDGSKGAGGVIVLNTEKKCTFKVSELMVLIGGGKKRTEPKKPGGGTKPGGAVKDPLDDLDYPAGGGDDGVFKDPLIVIPPKKERKKDPPPAPDIFFKTTKKTSKGGKTKAQAVAGVRLKQLFPSGALPWQAKKNEKSGHDAGPNVDITGSDGRASLKLGGGGKDSGSSSMSPGADYPLVATTDHSFVPAVTSAIPQTGQVEVEVDDPAVKGYVMKIEIDKNVENGKSPAAYLDPATLLFVTQSWAAGDYLYVAVEYPASAFEDSYE